MRRNIDYQQKLGTGWRIISAVVCALVTLVLLGIVALGGADIIRKGVTSREALPSFVLVGVMTFFASVTGYLAWRLGTGRKAPGEPMLLPSWFLTAFGWLFLAGIVAVAFSPRRSVSLVWGGAVAVAMILAGRRARQKSIPGDDRSSGPPGAERQE